MGLIFENLEKTLFGAIHLGIILLALPQRFGCNPFTITAPTFVDLSTFLMHLIVTHYVGLYSGINGSFFFFLHTNVYTCWIYIYVLNKLSGDLGISLMSQPPRKRDHSNISVRNRVREREEGREGESKVVPAIYAVPPNFTIFLEFK